MASLWLESEVRGQEQLRINSRIVPAGQRSQRKWDPCAPLALAKTRKAIHSGSRQRSLAYRKRIRLAFAPDTRLVCEQGVQRSDALS